MFLYNSAQHVVLGKIFVDINHCVLAEFDHDNLTMFVIRLEETPVVGDLGVLASEEKEEWSVTTSHLYLGNFSLIW